MKGPFKLSVLVDAAVTEHFNVLRILLQGCQMVPTFHKSGQN
jgi:hypothetical protein